MDDECENYKGNRGERSRWFVIGFVRFDLLILPNKGMFTGNRLLGGKLSGSELPGNK